ncbi:MAG TPA: oligosaccharide flippase family protein [Bacteroidales bacterium]|nr:oligosaccharide flippase family protein [Bacteroidales bacterium]
MARPFTLFSNLFLRSELLKSATVLISGTLAAQLISILLQPLLRRLFTPEDFGIYSVYLSLVGILLVASALRYDDAIVLPKHDKESVNLVGLSMLLNLAINLCILVLLLLAGEEIKAFLNLPESFPVPMLALIPVGTFLFSAYGSLNAWLIRKKKFMASSVNKLVRRSVEGASQVGMALLKVQGGLIYSDLAGQTANLGTVVIQTKRNGLNLRNISLVKLRYVARKYKEFPKYNLVPALMSTSSFLLPPVFINKFFSPASAGFFDLSKLVLSLPLAFIASSLTSVLLQKVSEKYNRKESFLTDIKPVLWLVGLIAAGEVLLIMLFGEDLFRIAFGKQWTESGTLSKIMVWSFAVNFW